MALVTTVHILYIHPLCLSDAAHDEGCDSGTMSVQYRIVHSVVHSHITVGRKYICESCRLYIAMCEKYHVQHT